MEANASSTPKPECVASCGEIPEIIPFQLGSQLRLRSLGNSFVKAQTVVVGVLGQNIILVEDPVFEKDDRITGRVGGDILVGYFHEGYLYKFKSRFGQVLIDDIVCIDYPKQFETQKLRRHPRIRVHLEAESVIGEEGRLINGDIKDISKGGYCLELPGIIPLTIGTPVGITFQLPNEELIEDLEGTIMNMRQASVGKTTHIGVSFLGPKPEVAKIKKFCEMCMYFKA
jgi:hypothetical protein